jgi:predicted histidine transporter YuiF (NhaC family)
MSDSQSNEQMQAKIQAARREAEALKDKIKTRKDALADTSRTSTPVILILASASSSSAKSLPAHFALTPSVVNPLSAL